MLAEAQEAEQMLDEEQLVFLADLGIPASQAQTIIPHNAAFHTEDLDTYDSDCDDLSTAQAVLMDNIFNYGSKVITEDLKAQIQDKVFVITSLKNYLRKLKGKANVDNATQIPSATTVAPGMFKLDLEPLAPKLVHNREFHINYLKHTQEQADILRGIVDQPKSKQPLDNALDFASKHAKRIQELLAYVQDTCPSAIKLKPNHTWGFIAIDIPSSSSLVMTGTVRFENDQIARIVGYGDFHLGNVIISRDAPSTSIPSSQEQEHSLIIYQGFKESPKTPTFHDDPLNESPHEDSTSQGSSWNVRQIYTSFEHLRRWTKDHLIANTTKDPSRSVSKRKQLKTVPIPVTPRSINHEKYTLVIVNEYSRILPAELKRNITDPSVAITDSSATDYDSADEFFVCSTPLSLLKKLDGAEPISGPKTIKSILRIISLERVINLRNPHHAFKRCEACGSSTHTITNHNDIEWFKRGEALQAIKAEALKSTRA
uniref:Integrase, catalytic region, zinc finger, CCHC-type, peptidase aspartic, catalytic n=1 Tax=Tanacetum cinerariifolium TaxID=118510 RepID=A0A6L2M1I6_TANCI|nr:hypothetical protein [Tanacetum cinerariifolium]